MKSKFRGCAPVHVRQAYSDRCSRTCTQSPPRSLPTRRVNRLRHPTVVVRSIRSYGGDCVAFMSTFCKTSPVRLRIANPVAGFRKPFPESFPNRLYGNYVKPINPQSWNLYAYARNKPLLYIDPTGNTVSLANCKDKSRCAKVLSNAAQLPKGVTVETKTGTWFSKGELKSRAVTQPDSCRFAPALESLLVFVNDVLRATLNCSAVTELGAVRGPFLARAGVRRS
jgi:hypothetical protein